MTFAEGIEIFIIRMLIKPVPATVLRWIPLVAIILLFIGFLSPLWLSPVNLYASFTDDFYYYLKIAESFNRGQGLSFTPGIATNGYQPFFQFFIVGLVYIANITGASPLVLIRIVLALFFVCFSLLLLKQVKPRGGVATLFFVFGLLSYYFIGSSGMESLFMVPVLAWYVIQLRNNSLSVYGAALVVVVAFFIRIDSFVITLPLFLYYLKSHAGPLPRLWKPVLLSGLIMGVPVLLYLLMNYLQYQTLFPISGMAKTVTRTGGINRATFQSFFHYYPYSFYNLAVTVIFILIVFTANFKEKIYFHLLGLATILFYVQTAIRSDWGLWAWYFYPIPVFAFLAGAEGRALFSGRNSSFSGHRRWIYATAAASTAVIVLFASVIWLFNTFPLRRTSALGEGKVDILHIAGLKIKAFEVGHKGIYAMGDRAGIVGYLMKSPLIQMEGLVMDKQYMSRMLKTRKLQDLLRSYKVDYYIATNPVRLNDSTYVVKEPLQSHGLSHQIIDTIRWNVCDSFTLTSTGVFTGKTNERARTFVFKVPGPEKQSTVLLQ